MKRNVPELISKLIEKLVADCYAWTTWRRLLVCGICDKFRRSPRLCFVTIFALFLDNRYSPCNPQIKLFIVAYADDILLITQSVVELQRLFHMCELELDLLEMRINTKKSCCLRIGPRFGLP